MKFKSSWILSIFLIVAKFSFAQLTIEGYVYESGNRGFIQGAQVTISEADSRQVIAVTETDVTGKYTFSVPAFGDYLLQIEKIPFFNHEEKLSVPEGASTFYVKHELERNPGYIFEITLSELDPPPGVPKDALYGALIEVYNNTKRREELVLDSLSTPDFQVNLIKGNHYTILIRKNGFISKRLEAYVDVEGCILCFDGVGSITPGVSDNLSNQNTMGVLLANIEIDRSYEGKTIGLNHLYYETNRSDITSASAIELDKVARFLRDNPQLQVELGAHTDSRGTSESNLTLSEKRARNAVEYLVEKGKVNSAQISAKGFGETRPVNKCRDGVKCTEEEHARNRRTELKVLGVDAIESFVSLRQMKMDEHLDEMLEELGAPPQKPASKEAAKDLARIEHPESPSSESLSGHAKQQRTGEDLVDDIRDNKQAEDQVQNLVDNIAENKQLQEVQSPASAETEQGILPDNALDQENATDADEPEFSGYRIVIHFSRYALPQEHPLHDRHDDLTDYVTADQNHLYLVGKFKDRQSAEKYRDEHLISKYPHAYIIGFENGTRIY